MSSSNCCFLTCIQISQEADQVVWYSLIFQNFPQFLVIHTVKGIGIVNKEEIDAFLELSCFFDDSTDVGNLISGSSAFSKTSLNTWKFTVHILLKPGLEFHVHELEGSILWKFCIQYASKFGKLSSGHRIGKGQFSFQSQWKAIPKNVKLLYNCTHLTH